MNRSLFRLPVNSFSGRPVLFLVYVLVITSFATSLWIFSSAVQARKELSRNDPIEKEFGTRHLLASSYYRVAPDLHTALMLHNKGPRTLEARPTLYSLSGQRRDIPVVTMAGNSHYMIDFHDLGIAGTSFQEGSIQVLYRGEYLELGAHMEMMDLAHGLIFDEHFVEPATMFSSSRLESAWWLPSRNCEFRLFISNTTGTELSVLASVTGDAQRQDVPLPLTLAPHETRVLNVRQDLGGEGGALLRAGGLSVEHSGPAGGVLARGIIQDASTGYSAMVEFTDPQKAKSSKLHGAGLRLGKVGGEDLSPVIVARNLRTSDTLLTGRVRYTTANGTKGKVTLPDVYLAASEVRILDITTSLRRAQLNQRISSAGLEFEYDGEPGSLIIAALAKSDDGDQVFRVPLIDPLAQQSSSGGYSWSVGGHSGETLVYIKNVIDRPAQYTLLLTHPGGVYMVGRKTTEAGETVTFDIRALRDAQIPDVFGRTIPLDATDGQVHWSVMGPQDLVLIGRSEQIDLTHGMSSTYFCELFCPDSFDSGYVVPTSAVATVQETTLFSAFERYRTTYGYIYEQPVGLANWSSSNTSVATVEGIGLITGQNPGTASITATWGVETYTYNPVLADCVPHNWNYSAPSASLTVNPQVDIDEVGFTGDHQITIWSSGTIIDNPDGSASTWKSTDNPNHPVSYTKGATPTMFAKFAVTPSLSPAKTADIRVFNGGNLIATKTGVTVSGDSVTVTGISVSSALESTVKTASYTLTWQISFNGGTNWHPMGNSGPHTIHWTYATPLSPPFRNDIGFTYSALYDLALQKACGYSNGASDLSTIISNMNTGVDADTTYDPTQSIGAQHPLNGYSAPAGIQCSDEANLLRGLLRSIGIDGTTLYIWSGPDNSTLRRYTIGSTGNTNPSFRIIRSSHDNAAENPHFKFHAVVSTNGTWYDPSYGSSDPSLSFDETPFDSTPQQTRASFWSSETLSSFVCPH